MTLSRRLILGSLAAVIVLLVLALAGAHRYLLLSAFAAAAVVLALTTLYDRNVSRPVAELSEVARALADGDLSQRPSISAPGKIGELSRAIHRMAEQSGARVGALRAEEVFLSALFDSLHEGVIAVDARRNVVRVNPAGRAMLDLRDPTPFSSDQLPRHRLLREALVDALAGKHTRSVELEIDERWLALTARPLAEGGAVLALFDLTALRRLENVRRDFVANVSHELRTPLTIVGGFAETLAEPEIADDQRRNFASLILGNTARMQRLVDDLLDLSRIESGGWRPKPVPLNLESALRESTSTLDEAAAAKGIEIRRIVPEEARSVFADPLALRQVLHNLVQNAVRYTVEGHITVRAHKDERGILLTVTDTGIGIPPEHLPRIFERFYRVDHGRAREQGGTGLGLAIVKHLVEAHGGYASAESIKGTGTKVSVHFPAAPADHAD